MKFKKSTVLEFAVVVLLCNSLGFLCGFVGEDVAFLELADCNVETGTGEIGSSNLNCVSIIDKKV